MKRLLIFMTLGLSACGSGTGAAGPPPTYVTPTMLQPPPIYALIGHRDRLELTSTQIEQLDSIAVDLEERNEILIDSLQANAVPTRNQTGLVLNEEGTPLLEQIRDNNREASEAVGRLLDTEQQESTCDLFDRRNDRRRERRPRVRGDQAAADSILRALDTRTWPWCSAPSQTDEDR